MSFYTYRENFYQNYSLSKKKLPLKKEYNIEFFTAEETVEAKAANKSEAKKLEIEEGTPVLSLHRLSSDKKGKAVEYSDLVIKSDMYKHKIMLFSDKVTNI